MNPPEVLFASIPSHNDLGILGRSPLLPKLQNLGVPVRLRLPTPERIRTHPIGGITWHVAQPVTFTPFSSVKACSARCIFCSETLVHRESNVLSSSLRPDETYFSGLRDVLQQLRGLPLGISLSGLESTDNASWFSEVLESLHTFENNGGIIEEKVLYTNAAGLARETTGATLLPKLQDFGLTRAEVSRHHFEQGANDRIMRFHPNQPIQHREIFEQTVRDILQYVPVRLVCILQTTGVATPFDVVSYLNWAETLGVREVVFREFSRLGDDYKQNRTFRIIQEDRVVLDELLEQIWEQGLLEREFEPVAITAGYYFWNLQVNWKNRLGVTFETSDYRDMKQRHTSGMVYKLIYHANGNLCADWDPEREVLYRTKSTIRLPLIAEGD